MASNEDRTAQLQHITAMVAEKASIGDTGGQQQWRRGAAVAGEGAALVTALVAEEGSNSDRGGQQW